MGKSGQGKSSFLNLVSGIDIPDSGSIKNQEHTHVFAYRVGAAAFIGKGIKGFGYVEVTGY